jgi:hypothetical protein
VDEVEADVLTRSQLLERRGYDGTEEPYGLANGHVEPAVEPVARTCDGCGSPLAPHQQRWCGRKCMKKDQYERSKGRTPVAAAPHQVAEDVTWTPASIIAVLLDVGATLEVAFSDDLKVTAWRG